MTGYWYGDRCHPDGDSVMAQIVGGIHGTPTMCNGVPAVFATELDQDAGLINVWPVGQGCTGTEMVQIRMPWPMYECEPYDFAALGITPAEVTAVAAWGFAAIVTGWALGLVAGWAAEAIRKA